MGNCLAGDACIFSHDPAHLINGLNITDGTAMAGTPPAHVHPSFQVQDYDFPSLQGGPNGQWAQSPSSPAGMSGYNYSGSPGSNGYFSPVRRSFEARNNQINGVSSSPASHGSRSNSRHQSRVPTPSILPVDDTEAFPSLGAAGQKGGKKHHGKRGGHGHGHSAKENVPNSLADVVRMSPSPIPSKLRQGLAKRGSYQNSRENSLAAQAIPAPQHVPWLETGEKTNQAYLRIRQEAFKHGGLRNKFLQRYFWSQ